MKIFKMSILFETNKFHHGGAPCSGGPGQLPPLPPLNPALGAEHLATWLLNWSWEKEKSLACAIQPSCRFTNQFWCWPCLANETARTAITSVLPSPQRQNTPNCVSEYAKQDKICQFVFVTKALKSKNLGW